MFRKGTDFTVLDRSRGEWGEAADDVASMSINYILFSLQAHDRLAGPFEQLYEEFMRNYLDKTGDYEMLEVIQPFYAWRSLVLANPIWYPTLSSENRRRFFNLIHAALDSDRFDIKAVNSYLSHAK
jgi:aminoglycoside phosphotransferase family enzyme